jgi:hypothetical protein
MGAKALLHGLSIMLSLSDVADVAGAALAIASLLTSASLGDWLYAICLGMFCYACEKGLAWRVTALKRADI